MIEKYDVEIFYSEEDKCYIATVPELEGCSAFGNSRDEALKEVQKAMKLWIDSADEHGDNIPIPRLTKKLPKISIS